MSMSRAEIIEDIKATSSRIIKKIKSLAPAYHPLGARLRSMAKEVLEPLTKLEEVQDENNKS